MKSAALTVLVAVAAAVATPASAASFTFTTGSPDGAMAMATRPASAGVEIEPADDFILSSCTTLTSATFTGLLVGAANVSNVTEVDVEIYRVFPLDSDTNRTITVPTRNNSPADVAFVSRASTSGGGLTFAGSTVNPTFSAANSVLNGIHPSPNQTTGGEFYWLSGTRPLVAPGTPFSPDLQTWMRNDALDPDWLRVGTDIVGAGTFNGAFTLTGTVAAVPEPETSALMLLGLAAIGGIARRRRTADARSAR